MRRWLPTALLLALLAPPAAAETVLPSDVVVLEDSDGSLYGAAASPMADAFLQKAACRLYQVRPDADPDVLFVVSSATMPLLAQTPSGVAVFRQARGIGIGSVDRRAQSCSTTRRLRHAVRMGDFNSTLPDDPRAMLKGSGRPPLPAVAVMAHEMGHYWLAHASYDPGDGMGQRCDLRVYTPQEGSTDTSCGGAPVSAFGLHWSFLFESGGLMFGSRHIEDLGDGTFRAWGDGTFRFGPLDQYLMGLRPLEQVGDLMLVRSYSSGATPDMYPLGDGEEVVFEGVRVPVDGRDVERFEGVRFPPLDPCHWKGLLVLVHPKGKPPAADRVQVLAGYANAYQQFYAEATDARGSIDLTADRRGRGTDECPDPLAPPPPADEGPATDAAGPADVPGPVEAADVPGPADLPGGDDGTPATDPGTGADAPRDAAAEWAGEAGGDGAPEACTPGALRCNPAGNHVVQQCGADGRTWLARDDCGLAGGTCRDGACVPAGKGGGCALSKAPAAAPALPAALALAAALALLAAVRSPRAPRASTPHRRRPA